MDLIEHVASTKGSSAFLLLYCFFGGIETLTSTTSTPSSASLLFISSSMVHRLSGRAELKIRRSDPRIPRFERVEAFCDFGVGEKMSPGSAEGFSLDLGVAPVLNRTLVLAFSGVGS